LQQLIDLLNYNPDKIRLKIATRKLCILSHYEKLAKTESAASIRYQSAVLLRLSNNLGNKVSVDNFEEFLHKWVVLLVEETIDGDIVGDGLRIVASTCWYRRLKSNYAVDLAHS
jgi:translation initiation factor 2 beta subunit (eIF-2beta)/eIF-5